MTKPKSSYPNLEALVDGRITLRQTADYHAHLKAEVRASLERIKELEAELSRRGEQYIELRLKAERRATAAEQRAQAAEAELDEAQHIMSLYYEAQLGAARILTAPPERAKPEPNGSCPARAPYVGAHVIPQGKKRCIECGAVAHGTGEGE